MESQPATSPRTIRFGLFELDLDTRDLRKSGLRIKLQEQPFQVLAMLLERPGAIVTRGELQKRLWPQDTFVDFDLSLNSAVKKLRQALNDDSENPRFVETLYRRGYRFIAPVSMDQPISLEKEASPAPPVESLPIQTGRQPLKKRTSRIFVGAVSLLVLLTALAAYRFLPPTPPRVVGFTQLTHDGFPKGEIFSDGERLYCLQLQGDHTMVSQVSVAGGETSVLPEPFANVVIVGIAPNGSALIVRAFQGTSNDVHAWSLPLPSGPPRRMGDFLDKGDFLDSMAWSPDGSRVIFSKRQEIYAAKSDFSDPKRVATVEKPIRLIRFSPDGRKLRFTLADSKTASSSIWEMTPDGKGLRPLLSRSNSDAHDCCGAWTPDGRYFLFSSFQNGRDNLWALEEKPSWLRRTPEPVQLTNGPLSFGSPLASKDGKRIFAIGVQPRCELERYDGVSGFSPYLEGKSISDVAFSADGKWVAYVAVPEGQLWRSRVDGSERLQLTFEGIHASLPRWSPDGKQIAFMANSLKTDWLAYLVSSDGTGMHKMIPGADAGYDPGWSPDGKSIVLTLNAAGDLEPHPEGPGIVIYDLAAGKVSPLPGARQLFSPRWSPDGRYIAAITNDSLKLVLFDQVTRKWEDLVSMPIGYPTWSHNGQYIYFDSAEDTDSAIFRMRISDHKLERVVSLKGVREYAGENGSWTGLTPDDSPLLVRDTGSQEIYALDWQP